MVIEIFTLKISQEVIERTLSVHEPSFRVLSLHDVRFHGGSLYRAHQSFQNVAQRDNTHQPAEFIAYQSLRGLLLSHLFQGPVNRHVLIEINSGALEIIETDGVVIEMEYQIFQCHHAQNVVQLAVYQRICLVKVLLQGLPDFLRGHAGIQHHQV